MSLPPGSQNCCQTEYESASRYLDNFMPDSNAEMWNPWKYGHALSRPFASPHEASVLCRKSKAALLEQDLPKLEKLIKRGKGLTKEAVDGRLQKVTPIQRCESAIPLDMRLASHVSPLPAAFLSSHAV